MSAEHVILGSIISDESLLIDYLGRLKDDFFTTPESIWVFQTIKKMFAANVPINEITLSHYLPAKVKVDIFFKEENIKPKDIEAYYSIVLNKYIRISLKTLATSTLKAIDDTTNDPYSILSQQENTLVKLANIRNESTPTDITYVLDSAYGKTVATYLGAAQGTIDGISLINAEVDAATGGAKKGEFTVIASRPSIGKSTYALAIGVGNSILGNKRGLIITPEMSKALYGQRILCNLFDISLFRVRTGALTHSDMDRIYAPHHCTCGNTDIKYKMDYKASKPLYKCGCKGGKIISMSKNYLLSSKLDINDTPAPDLFALMSIIKSYKIRNPDLEYVIIDHLQEIDYSAREDRRNRLNRICESIRNIGRELDLAMIVLSQINRESEGGKDLHPHLKHLKESGKIEEIGDLILLLHREGFYNSNIPHNSEEPLEVNLAKQRNGPIGKFIAKVNLGYQKIYTERFNLVIAKQDEFGKIT